MIVFCWCGFPQYGARCVKGFVDSLDGEEVIVVATRPKVPISGMEELSGCPVYWVEGQLKLTQQLPWLDLEKIRVLFLDGWCCRAFNEFAARVRKGNGKVICMVDNNLQYNQIFGKKVVALQEVIKALRFRLMLRWRYDGFFVPGEAGVRLMRFYGVSCNKVRKGFYAADATLFHDGAAICNREKKVIYVGQFCERKNVIRMVNAFIRANQIAGWHFELYGNGPLKGALEDLASQSGGSVSVYDFMQPEQLSQKYREARVFCLASVEEHWGLVVHEAALSGCALCVSDRVGAGEDFVSAANGKLFNPYSVNDIQIAFSMLFAWSDEQFALAQKESLRLSKSASIYEFASNAGKWVR